MASKDSKASSSAAPSEASPLVPDDLDDAPLPPFSFAELLRFTGPGLMMSLAYIDPGNLEVRRAPRPRPKRAIATRAPGGRDMSAGGDAARGLHGGAPDMGPLVVHRNRCHASGAFRQNRNGLRRRPGAAAAVQRGLGRPLCGHSWCLGAPGARSSLQAQPCPQGSSPLASQASAVRAHYPRWLNYTVYVNLELAIMGADLQDLLGTAHALRLLTGLPLYIGCVVSSVLSMLLLYVYEAQRRYMEICIGVTILLVCFCFFANTFHAQPEVRAARLALKLGRARAHSSRLPLPVGPARRGVVSSGHAAVGRAASTGLCGRRDHASQPLPPLARGALSPKRGRQQGRASQGARGHPEPPSGTSALDASRAISAVALLHANRDVLLAVCHLHVQRGGGRDVLAPLL